MSTALRIASYQPVFSRCSPPPTSCISSHELQFSMQMVAPTLQKAGVYYLWPGLQDTGSTGVYQEVLDGTSGYWWIGSGWCCRFVSSTSSPHETSILTPSQQPQSGMGFRIQCRSFNSSLSHGKGGCLCIWNRFQMETQSRYP